MRTQELTKSKLKKGDLVFVISGKNKNKQGKITRLDLKNATVTVEGLNMISRHTKPNQKNPQGGKITKEAPMHICKVMLVDPKSGKPTRVGKKLVKDSKTGKMTSIRIAKNSGTELK